MGESLLRNRLDAVIAGLAPDTATMEHPMISSRDPARAGDALQVLHLAQRTAAEHVAAANRQAATIRQDAQTAADNIARSAQANEQDARRRAEKLLSEADAATARVAVEARKRADDATVEAERIVAEARARAERIARSAQENAQELEDRARQRFDESVGTLRVQREALQRQIEALERFDTAYRHRLTLFMQGQLRALWPDKPEIGAGPEPILLPAPAAIGSAATSVMVKPDLDNTISDQAAMEEASAPQGSHQTAAAPSGE